MTDSKKNIDSLEECDHRRKLSFVDPGFTLLTTSRQTELLGVSRSSYYYAPAGNPERERLLKRLDEIYTEYPFLGSRRMSILLKQDGFSAGRLRIKSLMQTLGIRTIYPHKNTTIPNKSHKKYPYLLHNMKITHSNQVWSTDITYIRMKRGFIYLIAASLSERVQIASGSDSIYQKIYTLLQLKTPASVTRISDTP